jgi:lipopolysaccharide export system ATP-binding protein
MPRKTVKKSATPYAKPTDPVKHELRADTIVKVYGKRTVVDHVSYKVKQGEVVGLLGPNGAGKTTSFYITVGFIKATEGRVFLDDEDLSDLPMYMRARKGIGYLPQESSIFRKLSVEENLKAILEYLPISAKERKERVNALLKELDIEHVRTQKAYTLSGGERRRAEIARALTTDPDFLLLDEPFAGVDPIAVYDIQTIIEKLKKKGLGILITDHNVRETLRITDRAYIMNQGEILVQGRSKKIVNDPVARKVYLGESFQM